MTVSKLPRAMTISGSDSGGGAGIQADLKTFFALGVYGTSVITAVTAQNTFEVAAIAEVPEEVVIAQIDTVAEDIGADAVKTGMLVNRSIIQNVSDRLEAWGFPFLVVDSVMVSSSGPNLLRNDAIAALKSELFARATIVTSSIPEAQVLIGREIATLDDTREAARMIQSIGPEIVVITGISSSDQMIDLVYDGIDFVTLEGVPGQIQYRPGRGCTFSAAITAILARGADKLEAIRLANLYVTLALEASHPIGSGFNPLNHAVELVDELRLCTDGQATYPVS